MSSDFDNLCRICLENADIEETFKKLLINNISVLKIMENILYSCDFINIQGFPERICSKCLSILKQAHILNEKCLQSETRLKEMLTDELIVKEEHLDPEEVDMNEDPDLKNIKVVNIQILDESFTTTTTLIPEESSISLTNSKKHKCSHCDKSFDRLCRLSRHMKLHDSTSKPFACEAEGCYSRFQTPQALERHQIIHSGLTEKINEEKVHKCIVCSKEFQIQEALASHMKKHKDILDQIEFECSICNEKFKKLIELTRHSKTHPENKTHKCLICSKTFSQGSHLIDHLNRHNNLRPHVCEICNKAFQQSSTLKDHIRTHSQEKPFLCNECGKSFNNPSNLRQHVKRHLNLREHKCHLCPGEFSSKAALESHIRSHNGIKPFQCSTCGSSFTKGSSLKKHIRSIHEKIKPFECDVCSMKFHASEHLKRHKRSHTGDRPYVCNIEGCKKAYAQSNDLLKHKKVHLGELVYSCTLCTEKFRLQVELRNHYRVHYLKTENVNEIS